jgi:hypothetical protein
MTTTSEVFTRVFDVAVGRELIAEENLKLLVFDHVREVLKRCFD